MLVFLLPVVVGSEDGHIPTFWLIVQAVLRKIQAFVGVCVPKNSVRLGHVKALRWGYAPSLAVLCRYSQST